MSVQKRLERFLNAGLILKIDPPENLPKMPVTVKVKLTRLETLI